MLLEELKIIETLKIKMFVDNKSIIDLVNHPMSHGISEYIDSKYNFLRDQVNKDKLEIEYCKSKI